MNKAKLRALLRAIRKNAVSAAKVPWVWAVAVFGAVASIGTAAWATTTDPVASDFTTLQNKLVGYLTDAGVLVLAIAGIAIGLVMLVRWAKRAARS